jgi:hypothetical protein
MYREGMVVDPGSRSHRSQLFTVRVWAEKVSEERTEWRGQVKHVLSGRARYFRNWPDLIAFLEHVACEDSSLSLIEESPNTGADI